MVNVSSAIHRREERRDSVSWPGWGKGQRLRLPSSCRAGYQTSPQRVSVLVLHPSLCTSVWLDTSVCLADCRRVVFELPVQTDRCVHGEPLVTCAIFAGWMPVCNTEVHTRDTTRQRIGCPETMTRRVARVNDSPWRPFSIGPGGEGHRATVPRTSILLFFIVVHCPVGQSAVVVIVRGRLNGPRIRGD